MKHGTVVLAVREGGREGGREGLREAGRKRGRQRGDWFQSHCSSKLHPGRWLNLSMAVAVFDLRRRRCGLRRPSERLCPSGCL